MNIQRRKWKLSITIFREFGFEFGAFYSREYSSLNIRFTLIILEVSFTYWREKYVSEVELEWH